MTNTVQLTAEQIAAVGKTSLRRLNKTPLVYKCFGWKCLKPEGRTLDYGCGKNPVEITGPLTDPGSELVRYDICHFPKRPEGLFDTILVSNVLNILPDEKILAQTVGDIAGLLQPDGWVFVNFPSSPRKGRHNDGSVIDHKYVETLLNLAFAQVDRMKDFGSKSSPVFVCCGRK